MHRMTVDIYLEIGEIYMSSKQTSRSGKKKSRIDLEWENRALCSDGNCIGIIGPDGRCKECGKPYEGKLPAGLTQPLSEPDAETYVSEDAADKKEETTPLTPVPGGEKSQPDDDWGNRTLCSDGNCIGVIGPDGNCKECGKPYDPDAAD